MPVLAVAAISLTSLHACSLPGAIQRCGLKGSQ